MYTYHATVVRVVDGDTVIMDVDLGFYVRYQHSFRIVGIDAPEMVGATHDAGVASRSFLESILPAGVQVAIETAKADKYGRWLAKIAAPDGRDVSITMLASGHAVPY